MLQRVNICNDILIRESEKSEHVRSINKNAPLFPINPLSKFSHMLLSSSSSSSSFCCLSYCHIFSQFELNEQTKWIRILISWYIYSTVSAALKITRCSKNHLKNILLSCWFSLNSPTFALVSNKNFFKRKTKIIFITFMCFSYAYEENHFPFIIKNGAGKCLISILFFSALSSSLLFSSKIYLLIFFLLLLIEESKIPPLMCL